MKTFFNKLIHLGVDSENATLEHNEEVKVINAIKIQGALIIWITGIVASLFLPTHAPFMLMVMTLHFLSAIAVLSLNARGTFQTAKWIFVLDSAILVLTITAYFGVASNLHYIALICFLVFVYLVRKRSADDDLMLIVYIVLSLIGVYILYRFDIQLGSPDSFVIEVMRIVAYSLSAGLSVMMGVVIRRSNRTRSLQTHQTLEQSQKEAQILQSISDTMEEGIFKSVLDEGFVFINEAFVNMFGYDNKQDMMRIHPVNLYNSKAEREDLLSQILKHGKVVNQLMQYRRKDGSHFWGRLNCQELKEGDKVSLVGTIVDVTAQQEQTELLAQSERQLLEAQVLAKLGNWRMCPEDGTVVWSAECARIHGFLPEEQDEPFKEWLNRLEDHRLEELQSGIRRSAAMNKDFEFGSWFSTPEGESKFLYYICRLQDFEGRLCWYGTVQDNTTLKNQEVQLVATREFYQNILDAIPVETVLIDEDCNYFYISKNAIGDTELREWLIGKSNVDYAAYRSLPEQFAIERDDQWKRAFESDLTIRWEEKMQTRDGRDSYHLRNLVPIRLKEGKDERRFLIGYSFDINDIKIAQFRLERNNEELTKLNKELDRFVYSISHDLRAPIASVLGLNSLAEEAEDEEELAGVLAMQREALDRLDRYIRDVIDYARNKRLDITPEAIRIRKLVEDCLGDLQYMSSYNQLDYFIEIDDDEIVWSDKVRMQIILNNLFSNAIKYYDASKEKSFLSIRAAAASNGSGLELIVEDNGIGIKDEFKDQIWDIFFRGNSDTPGSGLGLYILNESIKNIGGSIELKGAEGEGTTFIMHIPDLGNAEND